MTDVTRRGWMLGWMGMAAPGPDDGREIVNEALRRVDSTSLRYEGTLTTTSAKGKKTSRRWRVEHLGRYGEGKTRIRFLDPPDVRGVALLILSRAEGPADQWLWIPAVSRSRRVGLQDRSTRFFGTDFTFEDLEERHPEREALRLLGEATVDGARCWRVEGVSRNRRESQYDRRVYSIESNEYVLLQAEKYSGDSALRILRNRGLEKVQGIWTARHIEMSDLRRGSRTVLEIATIQYNLPLKESAFLPSALAEEP